VAGQVYRELFGRETRVSGAVMLLVACSPVMMHAIVIANMTIIVALLLGLAALELTRRRDITSALAITLGGVFKYATVALLPLAIAMRRWKLVILTIVFAAALFGGTYAVTKQGPFVTYATEIAPTLNRPHTISTNQSVAGMLMRLRGWDGTHDQTIKPLPAGLTWAVRGVQVVTFVALMWLLFRRPVQYWDEPANVFAAAAALLCWLLIFAPIYWEHYPLYLAPLWAWLIWESRRSMLMTALAVLGIAAMWAPVTAYPEYLKLREPFNSHILIGTVVVMAAAVLRLMSRPMEAEGDEPRFELATPFEGRAHDEPVVPYGDEAE
jgi:hypothetical protein